MDLPILSDAEVNKFTVKLLKAELSKRKINFKGCKRKADYQKKLKEYFAEVRQNSAEKAKKDEPEETEPVKYLSDEEVEDTEKSIPQEKDEAGEAPVVKSDEAEDIPVEKSDAAEKIPEKDPPETAAEVERIGEPEDVEMEEESRQKRDPEYFGAPKKSEEEEEEDFLDDEIMGDLFKPLTELTFDSDSEEVVMQEEPEVQEEEVKKKKKKKKRKKVKLVFRNYIPRAEKLKKCIKPPANPIDNFEAEFADLFKAADDPNVEFDLTPKKIDWDLKRDVEKDLKSLERETQLAIQKILDERESSSEDESGSGSSSDGEDSS